MPTLSGSPHVLTPGSTCARRPGMAKAVTSEAAKNSPTSRQPGVRKNISYNPRRTRDDEHCESGRQPDPGSGRPRGQGHRGRTTRTVTNKASGLEDQAAETDHRSRRGPLTFLGSGGRRRCTDLHTGDRIPESVADFHLYDVPRARRILTVHRPVHAGLPVRLAEN